MSKQGRSGTMNDKPALTAAELAKLLQRQCIKEKIHCAVVTGSMLVLVPETSHQDAVNRLELDCGLFNYMDMRDK